MPDRPSPPPTRVSGTPGSASNAPLRVMLHTRWSAEAWAQVRVEFSRALAQERDPARGVQLARGCSRRL
jgi:hypothetical protein